MTAPTVDATPFCPVCRAAVVWEQGAAPWCEQCEWNLDAYEPPEGVSWLGRRFGALSHRIAYRLGDVQFKRLRGVPVDRPAWGVSRIVLVAFSVVFYAAIVAIAALAGWLITYDFPSLALLPGVLVAAIALFLAPRFGRLDDDVELLARENTPALHALVDRIAAEAGTRAPHMITVNPWFNASTFTVGIRRRRVLTLGLGLWGALGPQERVALLAHEVGHFANGDLRRGALTYPALTVLGRLSYLFTPSQHVMPFGLVSLLERLTAVVMRVVSLGLWLAHLGVQAIVLRDGHRAEYHADQRAAQIAGTHAAVGLFDVMIQLEAVTTVVAARARGGELESGWQRAVAEMLARQAHRVGRLRQLSVRRETSLLSTHPPTGLRVWLAEAADRHEPTIRLTARESDQIDAELATQYRRCRRDLAHSGY